MKLNCYCCLSAMFGKCQKTRKEKKECKRLYKQKKSKPVEISFSINMGTVEIKDGKIYHQHIKE